MLLLTGCASINYYAQSAQGQFELVQKREDIDSLLEQETLSPKLRKQLLTVLQLRKFSSKQLGLPDNNSYLSYADLKRKYVIWNIFATEEFSLTPVRWCYLIVGCLDYRGYFNETDARQHAKELKQTGHDIYLGGVSAYSTLGWFDDPVLNTMLQWNDIRLATVIFHELAHQQLYVKNDTEFNEAFAETIAYIGIKTWLKHMNNEQKYKEYEQSQRQEEQFLSLVIKYKELLNKLYQSGENKDFMRQQKRLLMEKMSDEYNALSQHWERNPYAGWFASGLNNAKLAAIVTYRKYVPALITIYEMLDKDLNQFYSFANLLSTCNQMRRKEILEKREIKFEC